MAHIDSEVIFDTLLADGLDFPTAYAASVVDTEPVPHGYDYRRSFDLGLIAGLVLFIAYHLI